MILVNGLGVLRSSAAILLLTQIALGAEAAGGAGPFSCEGSRKNTIETLHDQVSDIVSALPSENNRFGTQESFDLKVDDGRFNLDAYLTFPDADTPDAVFERYFLNGALLSEISDSVQRQSVVKNKQPDQGEILTLLSDVQKNLVTVRLVSNCKMTSIEQEESVLLCALDTTKAGGTGFRSFGTLIRCAKHPPGCACTATIQGDVKPYRSLGFEIFSAQELAVWGATQALNDMFALSYTSHRRFFDSKKNYKKTNFFQKNLEQLSSKFKKKAPPTQVKSAPI